VPRMSRQSPIHVRQYNVGIDAAHMAWEASREVPYHECCSKQASKQPYQHERGTRMWLTFGKFSSEKRGILQTGGRDLKIRLSHQWHLTCIIKSAQIRTHGRTCPMHTFSDRRSLRHNKEHISQTSCNHCF
jgi:hypothetical protein